jgi:ABC-type branched-subunit amino acid transport system ATPase component/branched-subunit amino acid ABC-type transport system permease component
MTAVLASFSRQRTRSLVGIAATVLLVAVIAQQSWSGSPVTGSSLLEFVLTGIAIGSIYAVASQGLVVTYATSGVFNFAQGAIGMFMAFVYWQLKVHYGLQTAFAFFLTVAVFAPLLGLLVYRILMRHLVDAGLLSQLVVTIGLMLALMGLASSLWNPNTNRSITTFFGREGFHIGSTFLPWYRFITIMAGVAVGIGLRFLLHHTRLGVLMRGVVDNRGLTVLNGAQPGRASMVSWMLGSSMAALAGVFLAEELNALDVQTMTLFIVDAFAAGIIARLRSLPMAYVGGMIIGLAIAFQETFLTWGGRWTSAPAAIPSVILFIALLFVPHGRIETRQRVKHNRERLPTMGWAAFGFVFVIVLCVICAATLSRTNVRDVSLALLTAFTMLSLIPLTGWANQISLANLTLAGFGAWAVVAFGNSGNLWSLVLAAAVAVPIGLLMAGPALRLQGLYLALATMAFAQLAEYLFFDQPNVFGSGPRTVHPLSVFGMHVSHPFSFAGVKFPQDSGFLIFMSVVFGIVGMLVVWSRRSPYGRRLIAMRDSPSACATMGVNLTTTKFTVFGYSAALAGLSGALFGLFYGSVETTNFQLTGGLSYLLLVVVGGVACVGATAFGGIALTQFTWLTTAFPANRVLRWFNQIGPGMAGIGIGKNPDGVWVMHARQLSGMKARINAKIPWVAKKDATEERPRAGLAVLTPREHPESPILSMQEINVRFGGLQAVRDVTLELTEGTITGLIGPNGAGKTTLFNVANGIQEPNRGKVFFDGRDVTTARPHDLARLGLARTFQRLEIFGSLSVRDNVRVACEARRSWSHDRSVPADHLADTILDLVGLQSVAQVRADSLPTGSARLLEVARSLAIQPRLLLFDEPSSGLDDAESDTLAELLRSLSHSGITILVVEHDMGFIMDLCSRVVVLDAGELIADGTPAEVQANPLVITAYLGTPEERAEEPAAARRAVSREVVPAMAATNGESAANGESGASGESGDDGVVPALALSGVSAGYDRINVVFDIDLAVMTGQVCALLGPNGAGKSTVLKVACGQLPASSGKVTVAGREIAKVPTEQLVRGGLGIVPEGRGIFPNLTVTENLKLASYAGAPLDDILESSFTRFPILGQRRRQLAGTLSGGEQQMLAISRALAVKPNTLLLDELSMGLAPIIVEQLYDVIAGIAEQGLTVLIVEQFAHQVLKVADVAFLLIHGRITHTGAPSDIDEILNTAYLGGATAASVDQQSGDEQWARPATSITPGGSTEPGR